MRSKDENDAAQYRAHNCLIETCTSAERARAILWREGRAGLANVREFLDRAERYMNAARACLNEIDMASVAGEADGSA